MTILKNTMMAGAAALALGLATVPASAGDLFGRAPAYGSVKDAPMQEGRKLEWSVNGGVMSDYVFRGLSQNDEDPSFFAGADLTYGIAYVGVWAAMVDPAWVGGSSAEVDFYAGITPKLGPATFDFGVIYYAYPNNDAAGSDGVEYVEFKAGISGEIVPGLSAGATYYYSPEYTFLTGETHTIEGTLGYTFQKVWIFEPTLDGTIGHLTSADQGSGQVDYTYWNVGLALAVEALTLDFRYWDTDIDQPDNFGSTGNNLGDERFVFTATVALP